MMLSCVAGLIVESDIAHENTPLSLKRLATTAPAEPAPTTM
jgi:hypothetical protein